MQRRGFSLIEILVSVALVGLITLVASILISTTELSRNARLSSIATQIASSALEVARAQGASALVSGPLIDARLNELPEGTGTLTIAPYDGGLSQVSVEVSWQDTGGEPKTYSITTLLAPEGGI